MTKPQRTRDDVIRDLGERIAAAGGKPKFRERTFRHSAEPSPRPAPKPTNGGPRVYESPVEELRDIGETLYPGEAWIPRLAKDLGELPRSVRKWVDGERKVPPRALKVGRDAVREQIMRLQRLEARLGVGEE